MVLELEGQLPVGVASKIAEVSNTCFSDKCGRNCHFLEVSMLKPAVWKSPSKSPWKVKHLLKLDLGVKAKAFPAVQMDQQGSKMMGTTLGSRTMKM